MYGRPAGYFLVMCKAVMSFWAVNTWDGLNPLATVAKMARAKRNKLWETDFIVFVFLLTILF